MFRSAPLLIAATVGLACSLIVWASSGIVARYVFGQVAAAPAIAAFGPSIALFCVFQVLTSALRGSDANLASAGISAVMFAVYLVACVAAFLAFDEPFPATAGRMYTLALGVACVPAALVLYRRPSASRISDAATLAKFGLITMLIHSASVLNLWADRIVVGVMSNATAVGVYQVASQLAMVALVLRMAVVSIFEARVPKMDATRVVPDVTTQFLASTRILLHVTAPGLICLGATTAFWTSRLFGTAYVAAAIPLAILVGGQLVLSFAGPSVTALNMTGDERYAAVLTIGSGLLNVVLNIALIPVFGLTGSAAASSFANFLLGAEGVRRLVATRRLRPRFGDLRDIVLAILACVFVALVWRTLLGADRLISVVALVGVSYVVYAAVVARLCRVEDELLRLIFDVVARLSGIRLNHRLPSN